MNENFLMKIFTFWCWSKSDNESIISGSYFFVSMDIITLLYIRAIVLVYSNFLFVSFAFYQFIKWVYLVFGSLNLLVKGGPFKGAFYICFNLNYGAKHIPLFSQRPFHFHCFIGTLFIVTRLAQYLFREEKLNYLLHHNICLWARLKYIIKILLVWIELNINGPKP